MKEPKKNKGHYTEDDINWYRGAYAKIKRLHDTAKRRAFSQCADFTKSEHLRLGRENHRGAIEALMNCHTQFSQWASPQVPQPLESETATPTTKEQELSERLEVAERDTKRLDWAISNPSIFDGINQSFPAASITEALDAVREAIDKILEEKETQAEPNAGGN